MPSPTHQQLLRKPGSLGFALLCVMLATGQAPAAENAPRTASEAVDELFADGPVRHLRLEIPPEGIELLRTYRWRRSLDPADRPKVKATVREGDEVYTNVALHLKGAAGSFRPIDAKPAFTLNFDKFAEGQRFHGLDKLSLNNSVQDASFISEKLCREIFLKAGVPVPRADYATVELNGRLLGLYVLAEGWDRRFLKQHFKDPRGNLYDPGMGRDIGVELPVTCGDHPEDQTELKALVAAANDPNPTNRLARLAQRLDYDRFLSFIALEVLLWHWDGYTMNLNNYRVFHDRAADRVVFMPHGMDQTFSKPNGPLVVTGRSLLPRVVLQTAEGRKQHLDRVAQLRATVFDAETLTNRVRTIAARLETALPRESLLNRARHQEAVNNLCQRIAVRVRSVDEQLEGVRNLLRLAPGESVRLTNWTARRASGAPAFDQESTPGTLSIRLQERGVGAWFTPVWLEQGLYRIEGRVRTRSVQADTSDVLEGAGLRVISLRKDTDGLEWGWFPMRRGADPRRRAEVQAPGFVPQRLAGTTNWTLVTYRIESRQPMADFDVLCELRADAGEAWFDVESLKLVREK